MIRKFQKQDIESIMQIWLNTNIKAHAFIPETYWQKNYPMVKEMIIQAEIWIYEEHNNIIGFLGIRDSYIAGIFISTTYQSNGIGSQLLQHVKKYHPILSLHVYKKNEKAIQFYQKHGFEILSEELDGQTNEIEFLMKWKQADF